MAQSNTEKIHKPLTEREEWIGSQIVNIAVCIHKTLGPGLLESIKAYTKNVFVMNCPNAESNSNVKKLFS
jgi:hypothetical protein